MGPYDLVGNNCHHAAQKIYNHCARFDRVDRIPNEELLKICSRCRGFLRVCGVTSSPCARPRITASEMSTSSKCKSEPPDSPSEIVATSSLCMAQFSTTAAEAVSMSAERM